jgi:hypothetical protein
MPNTYTELRKTTVGTATSSVTFDLTGISGYTDLIIVAEYSLSVANASLWCRLNSDTGSNYSYTRLSGNGTSATSGRDSNQTQARITADVTAQGSGTRQMVTLQFQNYSNATTYKTFLTRYNSVGGTEAFVDLWRNTNAITSIQIKYFDGTTAIEAGSTFSLYGIANADQGAAKATGGIITEDATYWYHTFGASSAFIPKQSLTCDVLVVAGGGAGGASTGAGGGAGGVSYQIGRSVSATTYNITVGGGGTAGGGAGGSGSNSVFDTITSLGGGGGNYGPFAAGSNGGSGGGGGEGQAGGSATQGNSGGATGYGNAGATGPNSVPYRHGGGGGAGAAGVSGSSTGAGGDGLSTWSSWGVVTGIGENVSGTYYLAGGGGGGSNSTTASPGGLGGGGIGSGSTNSAGLTNTGGGGGGAGSNAGTSRAGGSGVVIVRYAK